MATNYTQMVTATVAALMRDRGLNPTSLAKASGVPRGAIDDCLYREKPWKTSHLEAIATALAADLATIIAPNYRPEKAAV